MSILQAKRNLSILLFSIKFKFCQNKHFTEFSLRKLSRIKTFRKIKFGQSQTHYLEIFKGKSMILLTIKAGRRDLRQTIPRPISDF